MKEIVSEYDQPCDHADDIVVIEEEAESMVATENIMGKFWGSHHEISYYLIRD